MQESEKLKRMEERMHTRPKDQLATFYVHSNQKIILLDKC